MNSLFSDHMEELRDLKSLGTVSNIRFGRILAYWLVVLFVAFVIILFLPWTQNINATGKVTSLSPSERPQTIQSTIDGRIEKWFVREGQSVKKGDTIIHISEIKDQYFDPQLIERTKNQVKNKKQAVESYIEKIDALESQLELQVEGKQIKLSQARNKLKQSELKVTADSIDYEAAKVNFEIAQNQLTRQQNLFEQGLKSKTQLEKRQNNLQKERAKLISAQSKLLSSQNEVLNAKIELASIENKYNEKIAKSKSKLAEARYGLSETQGSLNKLRNQLSNYEKRVGYRYVTAPYDGYIAETLQGGVGQNIKQGQGIVRFVKKNAKLAATLYIDPVDFPLVHEGNNVRLQFDGWPAFVFSGWPNLSIGTYPAEVVGLDNVSSNNNKFRILVAPPEDVDWPELIRMGGGVKGFILLGEVPVWYEMWRQFNGFPPNFYESIDKNDPSSNANKTEIKVEPKHVIK